MGVLNVRPDTESGGGGGGGQSASDPIRKVGGGGGGGGGAVRYRSDAFLWPTENTLSLIINGYNFDRGGRSSTRSTPPGYSLHTLAYTRRCIREGVATPDYPGYATEPTTLQCLASLHHVR